MKDFKDNLGKTVSRNSLYTGIFNVWYLGTRLALTPLVLAYVSIEEYGLWSYCFVILSYLGMVGLGFNSTYIKYTADFRARHENQKVNELLSTGLITMTVLSAIMFSIFCIFAPNLLGLLGIDPEFRETARWLLLGSAAIFMLNLGLAGYQYVLEGEQRIDLVRKNHLAASVVEIVLIVLLLKMDLGILSLLWAYGIRCLIILFLNISSAYRVFPFLRVGMDLYRKEALKKFVNFGGQLQVLGFLSILINSADRIFITRMLHLEAMGFYETGRKLPNIGLTLPSALAGTMIPAAAHLDGSSQQDRLKRAYLLATRYLMILSCIPYAFLIFLAPQIIEAWLGNGYEQAVPVMQVLAFGTFLNLFTGVGTSCLRGMGKPKYEIYYMALSAVLVLTLAPMMIRSHGLVGAAWAFSISQGIGSLCFLIISNRVFDVSGSRFLKLVALPVSLIILMGIPVFELCKVLWPVFVSSRWTGLAVLTIAFSSHVVLAALGVYFLKDYLLLPEEKKKLASVQVLSPLNTIWKKRWKPA